MKRCALEVDLNVRFATLAHEVNHPLDHCESLSEPAMVLFNFVQLVGHQSIHANEQGSPVP